MVPVRLLLCRFSCVSLVRLPSCAGMVPARPQPLRLSLVTRPWVSVVTPCHCEICLLVFQLEEQFTVTILSLREFQTRLVSQLGPLVLW